MNFFRIESLGDLYAQIQRSGLLPDSKAFVDCIPKYAPEAILARYEAEKSQPGFELAAFLAAHFDQPVTPESGYESGQKPLEEHLHQLWPVLSRQPDDTGGTLIPLPKPYIVPGGRFREIYYWDSYFTMLGLQVSGRTDLIRNMVDNFAYLIDTLGFIPNGNRTYYLGRSQPPFFAMMLQVLAETDGQDVLLKYRPQLEKEYAWWMDGAQQLDNQQTTFRRVVRLADGAVLNRYWDDYDTPRPEAYREDRHVAEQAGGDPALVWRHLRAAAESGWDFSSRWFRRATEMSTIHTTDFVPVDLNGLLFSMEETLATMASLAGDTQTAGTYRAKAAARREAVQRWCWDDADGFFYDYNHLDQRRSPWQTLAAVTPLFFRIATPGQAERVAGILESKFLHAGGLTTTLERTGQQWDAPNGWAPLQWMGYQGLRNYGLERLAAEIRRRWLSLNEKTYRETGKMMEKYNVSDTGLPGGGGEYPNQDGFGWTNGVYLKMRYAVENSGEI